jgi:serine/threonine-protein kinase
MRENIPRQIGRYDIIALLGEGGMARAYLAVSRGPGRFNKLAVIKQILPSLSSDPNFVAMFLDEARLAARLHHPNIVQTFDVAEHDGNYMLAMEYIEGLSLETIFKRIHPKLLPLETHLWILTQILTGVHYAHTLCDYDGSPLGVVHRDVNPANVLVTYAGDVKLLDFGVAKARGALAAATEKRIKGKPGYCAPEQLRAVDPDARADVFAVGVMLWEALAGKRLNRGHTLVAAAKTRLSGREPKIREVCPDTDPVLASICDKALSMNPAERFTTAAEFRIKLQAQLDKLGTNGRQVLVERLQEVFAADRQELRRLIEMRLAEQSAPQLLSGPQPAAPVALSNPRHSFRWRLGILVGVGVVAAASIVGLVLRSPRKLPKPSQGSTVIEPAIVVQTAVAAIAQPAVAAQPPTVSPPPQPPAVPGVPPWQADMTVAAPVPAPPEARPASSPETRPEPVRERFANTRKSVPLRHLRPTTNATVAGAVERPTAQVVAPMVAPSSRVVHAAPSAPVKRRPLPSELSDSAVAPGAHLVRPPRPVHGSVDERDPYSP